MIAKLGGQDVVHIFLKLEFVYLWKRKGGLTLVLCTKEYSEKIASYSAPEPSPRPDSLSSVALPFMM